MSETLKFSDWRSMRDNSSDNHWRFTDETEQSIEMKITKDLVTFIDVDDLELVKEIKCGAIIKKRYCDFRVDVSCNPGRLLLHRLIMKDQLTKELNEVDHIDGNPLNNRRSNLRPANRLIQANNCKIRSDNATGVPGVYHHKLRKQYIAEWVENGKTKSAAFSYTTGSKRTEKEAYDLAVKKRKEKEIEIGKIHSCRPKEGVLGQIVGPEETFSIYKTSYKQKPARQTNPLNFKLTDEKVNEIRTLFNEKKFTREELASQFNVCHSSICRILKKRSWKKSTDDNEDIKEVKVKATYTRLTPQQVIEIRKMNNNTDVKVQAKLAEQLNVTTVTINNIVTYKTWINLVDNQMNIEDNTEKEQDTEVEESDEDDETEIQPFKKTKTQHLDNSSELNAQEIEIEQ